MLLVWAMWSCFQRVFSLIHWTTRCWWHETCWLQCPGSFPCLRAYLHLERRLRAYILSTFLPSLLVVLLSWVSFWIDLESVPARISLGILTMLTITTQSSVHMRGMPTVSFTKAIDVWMATCLVFVFGSFIEYSIVNVLARREKTRRDATTASSATSAIVLPVPQHNVDQQAKVRMRSWRVGRLPPTTIYNALLLLSSIGRHFAPLIKSQPALIALRAE